jgi:hypothetical protein
VSDLNGFVWEDPPPQAYGGPHKDTYANRLEVLVKHPDRWARVSEHRTAGGAYSAAYNMRRAISRAKNLPGFWEVAGRKRNDNGGAVYVRYRGTGE